MLWCFLLIGCFFLMFQRGKFAKYSYNYHTFAEWSLKISKHKTSQRSPVCSILLFEIRKHNKPVISARIALVSTMNDPLHSKNFTIWGQCLMWMMFLCRIAAISIADITSFGNNCRPTTHHLFRWKIS